VFEQHERFTTTAKSIVEVKAASDVVATDISWEESRDAIAAESDESCLEASEYTFDSPYVPTSAELAEYAQKTFAPKRPLIEAVKELSTRIHTEFKYRPASTSIDMPLSRVLRERCGVCQDFAHIMIGAMRSLRLSARYVSGYVRTGAKFQGAQASHAWVSVFIPGHGWQSIDPTNNLMPSDSHVTLAWGRDYGDVAPVKGITLGGGKHTVEVEVYTVPAEGEQPTP
jgi:transglutaminase-like putative cysteine protease